jgi:hypothetical protein
LLGKDIVQEFHGSITVAAVLRNCDGITYRLVPCDVHCDTDFSLGRERISFVDKASIGFAALDIAKYLPHIVPENEDRQQRFPELGGEEGRAGITSSRNSFWFADGDAFDRRQSEAGKRYDVQTMGWGDEYERVECKVTAKGGDDMFAGSGFVHSFLIGGSKNVYRGALLYLSEKIGG